MAALYFSPQSDEFYSHEQESSENQISEDQAPEKIMPPPFSCHLPNCLPKIIVSASDYALAEDQKILENILKNSENLSTQLQQTTVQFQVQKLRQQVEFCTQWRGSEDYWLFFCVYPTLRLALELSGLNETAILVPLRTANIGPSSLETKWNELRVARRVDLGLVLKLQDDAIIHQITTLPDQENKEGGIGPAPAESILQTHPLFCHIEVKKQHQEIDPIVQLGVWTSAVYTRWEQVTKILQGSSSRDLPISFGWTVEGCCWKFYIIRRLSNGSRRITRSSRVYNTESTHDIYLVIATLYHIIEYGNKEFRKQFLDSVLGIRTQ